MSVERATVADALPRAPRPGAPVVDVAASRLRFVYPFVFDGRTLERRAAAVESAFWEGSRRRLTVWRPQEFSTADLLANVAAFLHAPEGLPRGAALWRMDADALRSPAGLGGGAEHGGAAWTLCTPHGDIGFALHGVELALFRHGVGFLTVHAQPVSASPDDWFTFIHHFRFAAGERSPVLRAERRPAPGAEGGAPRANGGAPRAEYFPPVAGPATKGTDRRLGEVIDGLLLHAAGSESGQRWWEEIFVPGALLPYTSMFIDGADPGEDAAVLYRLRNFFHAAQEVHPAGGVDALGALEYAQREWFFFSLNGGGFLAQDAPGTPFFRNTLPAHIGQQYFLLFLLALQQRFVLMMLSQEVSRRWVGGAGAADRAAAFGRIHEAVLAFTAQGYFAQTMQEEHHHRNYERWVETFQLAQLYAQVGTEVREMHADLELRARERAAAVAERRERQLKTAERRINRVGFLVGVPVWLFILVNSAANVALVRNAVAHAGASGVQWYDMVLSLGLGVLGIGLGVLLYRMLSRSLQR